MTGLLKYRDIINDDLQVEIIKKFAVDPKIREVYNSNEELIYSIWLDGFSVDLIVNKEWKECILDDAYKQIGGRKDMHSYSLLMEIVYFIFEKFYERWKEETE